MAFNLGRTICSICSHKAMLCLTLLLLSGANLQARPSSPLVTFESAAQSGLQRAWFAQIRVDQTRYRIHRWLLAGDRLLAVTTGGTVHVLDATTGEPLVLGVSVIRPWALQSTASMSPSSVERKFMCLIGLMAIRFGRKTWAVSPREGLR